MLAWKLAAIASEQLFDGFVFETTITPETLPLIKGTACCSVGYHDQDIVWIQKLLVK
jgi:hypothetical protein